MQCLQVYIKLLDILYKVSQKISPYFRNNNKLLVRTAMKSHIYLGGFVPFKGILNLCRTKIWDFKTSESK